MKRTDGKRKDPREKNELVYVDSYKRADGTEIKEHTRLPPVVKGKLKFTYPGRVKGKLTEYRDGKKVQTVKINQPLNGKTEIEGHE